MGVHPDFLVDDEWERHRINYHVLLAQAEISDAGPQLAQAVVAAQRRATLPRAGRGGSGRAGAASSGSGCCRCSRRSSGGAACASSACRCRPPWAHAYLLPLNVWRYHLLGRSRWGRERLDRWGRRRSDAILASYGRVTG